MQLSLHSLLLIWLNSLPLLYLTFFKSAWLPQCTAWASRNERSFFFSGRSPLYESNYYFSSTQTKTYLATNKVLINWRHKISKVIILENWRVINVEVSRRRRYFSTWTLITCQLKKYCFTYHAISSPVLFVVTDSDSRFKWRTFIWAVWRRMLMLLLLQMLWIGKCCCECQSASCPIKKSFVSFEMSTSYKQLWTRLGKKEESTNPPKIRFVFNFFFSKLTTEIWKLSRRILKSMLILSKFKRCLKFQNKSSCKLFRNFQKKKRLSSCHDFTQINKSHKSIIKT